MKYMSLLVTKLSAPLVIYLKVDIQPKFELAEACFCHPFVTVALKSWKFFRVLSLIQTVVMFCTTNRLSTWFLILLIFASF